MSDTRMSRTILAFARNHWLAFAIVLLILLYFLNAYSLYLRCLFMSEADSEKIYQLACSLPHTPDSVIDIDVFRGYLPRPKKFYRTNDGLFCEYCSREDATVMDCLAKAPGGGTPACRRRRSPRCTRAAFWYSRTSRSWPWRRSGGRGGRRILRGRHDSCHYGLDYGDVPITALMRTTMLWEQGDFSSTKT